MPCFSQMSLNRPLLLARAQFHKVISQLRFFRATKQNIKKHFREYRAQSTEPKIRATSGKHRQYAVLMILRKKKALKGKWWTNTVYLSSRQQLCPSLTTNKQSIHRHLRHTWLPCKQLQEEGRKTNSRCRLHLPPAPCRGWGEGKAVLNAAFAAEGPLPGTRLPTTAERPGQGQLKPRSWIQAPAAEGTKTVRVALFCSLVIWWKCFLLVTSVSRETSENGQNQCCA